jgi:hypothetical protein
LVYDFRSNIHCQCFPYNLLFPLADDMDEREIPKQTIAYSRQANE